HEGMSLSFFFFFFFFFFFIIICPLPWSPPTSETGHSLLTYPQTHRDGQQTTHPYTKPSMHVGAERRRKKKKKKKKDNGTCSSGLTFSLLSSLLQWALVLAGVADFARPAEK
ncbi:hypothetical protein ACMBCN_02570, partial [Candidatus Liberibacter asiaticus]|nr:mitochondrial pyruvate carrier family protein [Candidatus Liberibacter asiaticus]